MRKIIKVRKLTSEGGEEVTVQLLGPSERPKGVKVTTDHQVVIFGEDVEIYIDRDELLEAIQK